MEQLPLTFVQSTVEPDIQECFTPAYNFTKLSSSNGRLAFTTGKIYWLPDNPIALMDQGWVLNISEVAGCDKYGLTGFIIRLTDGKELRFSNVGAKMRDGISEAIEAHRSDKVADEPAADATTAAAAAAAAGPAPQADPEQPVPPVITPDAAAEVAGLDKVMGVLAYLGVLVIIPLLAAKDSKFARFHANQGLILLICTVVIYIVGRIFPGLSVIITILDVAVFVLAVIGIINVIKGETKKLPLVGNFNIIG